MGYEKEAYLYNLFHYTGKKYFLREHTKNLNANVRARPDVTFWAVGYHPSPRVQISFSHILCKKENTLTCKRISRDRTHVPKYFYSGNRHVQVLHTRLRTQCSALNHDLFKKNISDTPLCRCGSIENTHHFFFKCPFYNIVRNDLLHEVSTLHDVSLKLLFYGYRNLSNDLNTRVFESVHKYILKTKRFSSN